MSGWLYQYLGTLGDVFTLLRVKMADGVYFLFLTGVLDPRAVCARGEVQTLKMHKYATVKVVQSCPFGLLFILGPDPSCTHNGSPQI